MHIQIITFNLHEMTDTEYRAVCDELAAAFAALPGLVRKVWLADADANTYGGVYTWATAEALEAYKQSDLFAAVASNPHFRNVTAAEFAILDAPSRVTSGAIAAAS